MRADETLSHEASLNHEVMEILMQELDTACAMGNDTAATIEEQMLAAFRAVEDGDPELATSIIKEMVGDLAY